MVAIKLDNDTDDIKQTIIDALDVPSSSLLYSISKDIATFLVHKGTYLTQENVDYELDYNTLEEAAEDGNEEARLVLDGYRVLRGYASYNETDNPAELLIGNGCLRKIDTEKFKLWISCWNEDSC